MESVKQFACTRLVKGKCCSRERKMLRNGYSLAAANYGVNVEAGVTRKASFIDCWNEHLPCVSRET